MVKQRITSADVAAEVACLKQRGLIGMRLANIYDISPRVYVFKFSRSGDDGDKVLLLVESGARFHTVNAMPDKSDAPSNFSLKLRKHLRTRRLEAISQLGCDRLLQLTFGSGDKTHHLILEFYAQGNVVLTDHKYVVLTLLRSHRDDAKNIAIMARHTYPIHTVRLRVATTAAALESALTINKQESDTFNITNNGSREGSEVQHEEQKNDGNGNGTPQSTVLKAALADFLRFGPQVAEHCALKARLNPNRDLSSAPLNPEEHGAMFAGVKAWEKWLEGCDAAAPGGAILVKPSPSTATASNGNDDKNNSSSDSSSGVYDEFEPLLEGNTPFEQHTDKAMVKFATFDDAISEFFGKIQGQRAAQQQAQREKQASAKLDAIRKDHSHRLVGLTKEVEDVERKAYLIETNLELVEAALSSVNEALEGGLDWTELAKLIKEEKRGGNPVAALVDSLQLDKGRVTLLLSDWGEGDEEGDEEAEMRAATRVEVELNLSAYANARRYYDMRRKHTDKHRRTLEANQSALKAAEAKAQEQLLKVKAQAPVNAGPARKPHWFEKFHWFISAENYLVLSGRDAQQNELIVKRYMKKGDAYVHADLHGAASCIIKNHNPTRPIPPLTLFQAGQACICRSAAWSANIVASAWWVHPEQVSKTAPTGEYLTTGSFIIRGRKNYLPPQPLVMGIGFLFRLEDSCVAGHIGERAPRTNDDDDANDTSISKYTVGGASSSSASSQKQKEESASIPSPALLENLSLDGKKQGVTSSAYDAFMESSFDQVPAGVAAVYERYGLSSSQTEEQHRYTNDGEHDDHLEGSSAALRGLLSSGTAGVEGGNKRHLSAKERQLKKKGLTLVDPEGGTRELVIHKKGTGKKNAAEYQQQQQQQQQSQQQQSLRGKSGKGKKVKQRYADQDDDEKELAMQLLQSAGQKKDRKQKKAERKQRMAARKMAQTGLSPVELTEEEIAKLTAKPSTSTGDEHDNENCDGASSKEGSESDSDEQAEGQSGVDSGAAHPPASATNDEQAEAAGVDDIDNEEENDDVNDEDDSEEIAALMAEESIVMLGEEDRERLTPLDAFTGQPRPEDTLLYALPVCAPYAVLQNYKYRVKLIPGPLKKGKAGKQAVELLAREAGQGRERDLMKAVPEQELINAVIGGCRLQSAGLQKLQKIQRGQKKKK